MNTRQRFGQRGGFIELRYTFNDFLTQRYLPISQLRKRSQTHKRFLYADIDWEKSLSTVIAGCLPLNRLLGGTSLVHGQTGNYKMS